MRTPTDIFPEIRIPVIAVVWQYTGLPPDQMSGRVMLQFQRALTTTVNDIEHIEGDVLHRRRHRQGLLPAGHRHPHRQRAGHGDLADGDQADAAQHHAAADPQLQRLDRADHPAGARRQGRLRAGGVRHRHQHGAHAADHGAGSGDSVPLRRQVPPDPDRPRSSRSAGARPVGQRRRQRALCPEPLDPGGHAEDRRLRVRHPAQQRAERLRGAGRPADLHGQRRHGLPARRRPGARRQPAADQHRACRWRPLGAAAGAEERLGVDARHHRRHQAARRGAAGRSCPTTSRSPSWAISRCSWRAPSAAWRSRR